MGSTTRAFGLPMALLFFLSGSTALIYELVWFKRFSQVWGSSSYAMGAVVAAFLLGLGVGARTLGTRASRSRAPLKTYAVFEAAICVFAALSLFAIEALRGPTSIAYEWFGPAGASGAIVRLLLAFLVLGPPTILMGATLPLLVAQFELEGRAGWRGTALLYATNTLGAAAGCFVTGFFLLPQFGLRQTLVVAIAVNLLVVVAALFLARSAARREVTEGEVSPVFVPLRRYTLAALALGVAALSMHMIWARQLSLVLGGTTYSFTAMLFLVLVGIGVGSLVLERLGQRVSSAERLFAGLGLVLVLSALSAQWLLPTLSRWAGSVRAERNDLGFNASFCSAASAALELVPALCSGALLPLLVRLARASAGDVAASVGQLFAWNTVGSAIGATLTAAVLFPVLGTTGGVVFCALLVALAVLLALRVSATSAAPLVVCLGLAWPVLATRDPLETGLGLYLYGNEIIEPLEASEVLFAEEGPLASVLVTELGSGRSMRVGGKVDASNLPGDMVTQLGAAYFPRFLAPNARDLLIVGYGSGCTVGASLLFPGTRVTCLEIEPAVLRAAAHFDDVNHKPLESPGLNMVVDDARAFVESSSESFDLIITEPSNPWMPGVSNLFTREFYEAADKRMREGALLVQWVQIYALSVEDYSCILATLGSVFEHVWLLCLEGGDTLLVASHTPIETEPAAIDRLQTQVLGLPEVRADLLNYFQSEDVRGLLLRHVLMDDALRLIEGETTELHTDWNMRLEYDSTRRLFEALSESDFGLLATFVERARIEFPVEFYRALGGSHAQVPALAAWARTARRLGRIEQARERLAYLEASGIGHPELGAEVLLCDPPGNEASRRALLIELFGVRPSLLSYIAREWQNAGELAWAREALDALIERDPERAKWRRERGRLLRTLGDVEAAKKDLEAANRLEVESPSDQ